MGRAHIQIRQQRDSGDYHEVEFFFIPGGVVIHRHILTENEELATAWKKHRKFWDKWYTMQEVVILRQELKLFLWWIMKHPFHAYRLFKKL